MTLTLPLHFTALRSVERAAHSQPLDRKIRIASAQPLPLPTAPSLKEQSGEKAATPGHRPRAHARVWNIPRQFTLVNRRSPLALLQSSGKPQELTFDVSTLLPPFPQRNEKHAHACAQPVDEAPSLWKLEEKWKINRLGKRT